METAARAGAALGSVLIIGLLSSPLHVAGGEAIALREQDIQVAITLAGARCGLVTSVVEKTPTDYSVQCRNGKRFRVYVTEDRTVHVVDRSPGVGAARTAPEDHQTHVARSLFAVVNLSGYDCDEVIDVEREPQLGYRVSCRNDTRFRISVLTDGRVRVERIR